MGILLTRGFAFEGCGNGFGGRQQGGIDDIGRGARAAITGIDQLQGAGGRGEADQSQLEQPSGSVVTSRSRVASEKAYLCGQRGWRNRSKTPGEVGVQAGCPRQRMRSARRGTAGALGTRSLAPR